MISSIALVGKYLWMAGMITCAEDTRIVTMIMKIYQKLCLKKWMKGNLTKNS